MRKKQTNIRILVMAYASILFFLSPVLNLYADISDGYAEEASAMISLKPDYKTFLDPDYLVMDIVVTPGQMPVNAFDLALQFDKASLFGLDVSFSPEPDMLLIEQTIDNQGGRIRLIGGTPAFGITTTTPIARIRFAKLTSGWTTLEMAKTELLAADGLGTTLPVLSETHKLFLYK